MLFFNHDIDLITRISKAVLLMILMEENGMDLDIDLHVDYDYNKYTLKENFIKLGIKNIISKYELTDDNDLYEVIHSLNEELFPVQS